jgi:transcriptional regulator with XRE-family HTH domain
MVSESQRAVIRRSYRMLRLAVEKTQIEVEALAGLDAGRFWKIENGYVIPTDEEIKNLAKVLKVAKSKLPIPSEEAKAS